MAALLHDRKIMQNVRSLSQVECGIYSQHIGTAMETSFLLVYAVIFMILLTMIVEDPRFRQFIKLYK